MNRPPNDSGGNRYVESIRNADNSTVGTFKAVGVKIMSYLYKVKNAVWGPSNHNDIESLNTGKYMLKVTAGSVYDFSTQKPVLGMRPCSLRMIS